MTSATRRRQALPGDAGGGRRLIRRLALVAVSSIPAGGVIGLLFGGFFLLVGNPDWLRRQTLESALWFLAGWATVCAGVAAVAAVGATAGVLVWTAAGHARGRPAAGAVGAAVLVLIAGIVGDLAFAPWPIYSYIAVPVAALAAGLAAIAVRRAGGRSHAVR